MLNNNIVAIKKKLKTKEWQKFFEPTEIGFVNPGYNLVGTKYTLLLFYKESIIWYKKGNKIKVKNTLAYDQSMNLWAASGEKIKITEVAFEEIFSDEKISQEIRDFLIFNIDLFK